jgi:hypothetical protein
MVADRTAVMSLLRPHPYCQRGGVVMMPIDEMTLQEIEHELRSYSPAAEFAADRSEAHRERRARLWRRLDTLTRSGAGITAG